MYSIKLIPWEYQENELPVPKSTKLIAIKNKDYVNKDEDALSPGKKTGLATSPSLPLFYTERIFKAKEHDPL